MKITNNSIIDTVIDYANVKFGMEAKQEDISKQLKLLSYRETLALVDAIKNEDDEGFSEIIDLSAVSEAYGTAAGAPMVPKASSATIRAQNQGMANANRRNDNIAMKQARAGTGSERKVGGNGTVPTASVNKSNAVKRPQDADSAAQKANNDGIQNNNAIAMQNAEEIERLKQLAMGRR